MRTPVEISLSVLLPPKLIGKTLLVSGTAGAPPASTRIETRNVVRFKLRQHLPKPLRASAPAVPVRTIWLARFSEASIVIHFLPMQYRFWAVRMKICPSEMAGELRQ
jgi:hypothetical protein